jgi:DNA-binding protein H-NS
MSFLINLLTLPVSAPIKGTLWIAEQVRAAAEQELQNEQERAREALEELEYQLANGDIDELLYEEKANALIARYMEAAESRAALKKDEGGQG